MAALCKFSLSAEWNWSTEQYNIEGSVTFMFGATMYTLLINQQVIMPTEYVDIAAQVEHVFIDVAAAMGKLSNAQMSIAADEVQPYL